MRYLFCIVFLAVSFITYSQSGSDLNDNVVGVWPMNEASGSIVDEINGNNGTATGATQNVTGKMGKCTSYDGNDYVTTADDADLYMAFTDHSFDVWVYISGYPAGGTYYTLMGAPAQGASLLIDENGKLRYSKVWHSVSDPSTGTIGLDGWHNVGCSVDDAATNSIIFYIDGVAAGTVAYIPDPDMNVASEYFGVCQHDGTTFFRFMNGMIDEPVIWKYILPAALFDTITNGPDGTGGEGYPFPWSTVPSAEPADSVWIFPYGKKYDAGAKLRFYDTYYASGDSVRIYDTYYTLGLGGGEAGPYEADHFVATDGSDSNPGTYNEPWLTWQYALEEAAPGDLIYVRGGVYAGQALVSDSNGYASQRIRFIHGTKNTPIRFYAYPGEQPIYNLAGLTINGNRMKGFSIKGCSHLYLKGLRFINATQISNDITTAMWVEQCDSMIIENCEFDHNDGPGLYWWGSASEGNFIHNCDFHDNADPYGSYGNADGLDFCRITERAGNERKNYVSGCRAWNNSDDGFDFVLNPGYMYIDSCWSWANGYSGGNGNGFKLGENDGTPELVPLRILRNNLAFYNLRPGFSQNQSYNRMNLFNNVAYGNKAWGGFYFGWHNVVDTFRNNIAYSNEGDNFVHGDLAVHDHNSWDASPSVTITSADFVTLDSAGVSGPRGVNGELPNLGFLKLISVSDMVDAGVDVGLAYDGSAPDMGAFETYNESFAGDVLWVDNVGGNDSNTGLTSADPVKTFGKAETIFNNTFEYLVIANGADYYESLGLNSITRTYGNPAIITTWHKYGPENAILKGLTNVTGWSQSGNHWTKTLSGMPKNPNIIYGYLYGASHLNGIYINGTYHDVSRYPNGTYNYLSMESSGTGYLVDDQELKSDNYWNTGWIVTELSGAEWVNTKLYISDYNSGLFTYTGMTNDESNWDGSAVGLKYFIQNHYNAEDVNGEWTQNYSTNGLDIYYTSNLNSQQVYVPLVDSVIGVTGSSHIIIDKLDLYGANKEQIDINGSLDITVQNCNSYRAPVAAIGVFNSDTITVQDNNIYNPNDNGIAGWSNNFCVYTRNYIRNAGVSGSLGGDRIGVHLNGISEIQNTGDVYINYNHIDSVGYCGIQATGFYAEESYLNDDHIYIDHNYVNNAKMILDDGGAVYVSGYSTDGHQRRIRGNIITNQYMNRSFNRTNTCIYSGSIYCDRETRKFIIDSNLVWNSNMDLYLQGYQLTNGQFTVRDNVFAKTRGECNLLDFGYMLKFANTNDHVDSVRFTKNKLVEGPTATGNGVWFIGQDSYQEYHNVLDSNDYYDPFNNSASGYVWMSSVGAPTWTFTNRDLTWVRANTSWEDHGTFNKTSWDFTDVSGITEDEFLQCFINWSSSSHNFDLGSAVFKDLEGVNKSGTFSVPAYSSVVLMYVSGSLSSCDDRIYIAY